MRKQLFIDHLPPTDERALSALYSDAVKLLTAAGLTVSTAESCTGGLLGKLFTDVPGASAVFAGGMITYTNHIKTAKLGVSEQTIQAHTEVSFACAAEMAERARTYFESELAISATGYAGPGGGTEEDPVGTVYVALASEEETLVCRLSFGERSREEIRMGVAHFAAKTLRERLSRPCACRPDP